METKTQTLLPKIFPGTINYPGNSNQEMSMTLMDCSATTAAIRKSDSASQIPIIAVSAQG